MIKNIATIVLAFTLTFISTNTGIQKLKTPLTQTELQAIVERLEREKKQEKLEEILGQIEINTAIDSMYIKEDNTKYGNRLFGLKKRLKREGYEPDSLFNDSTLVYANILRISKKRGRNLKYNEYKKLLSLDVKKEAMPIFLDLHGEYLDSLVHNSDIPKEITAAIHGIESNFWTYLGDYNAFNLFVSKYIKYGSRSKTTRRAWQQLTALLDVYPLSEEGIDVRKIPSSHAGAIWYPQFMPWSIKHYAIGDISNPYDALASTDNYLKMTRRRSLSSTIYRYNHSWYYVRAVMELAGAGIENDSIRENTPWLTKRAIKANTKD